MRNNADFIKEFENRLAEYCGSKHAVVVDSCSNALFLAMQVLIEEYDIEQVIPKRTYLSVPAAMIRAGFTPIFEDIEWSGLYQIGDLPIIDSAQRFTSNMYVKDTLHCVSFHAKKILNIGKGGAILTDDSRIAKLLRRLAFDGRDYTKGMMEDDIFVLGYHMNMPPADAAKGLLLLNQLGNNISDNGNHECYRDLTELKIFGDINGLNRPEKNCGTIVTS